MTIVKTDGTEYEPSSVSCIHASIVRYLRHHGYKHDIKTDPLFAQHRDVTMAKRKFIKSRGKGETPYKSDAFTDEQITILYDKQLLGTGQYHYFDYTGLQNYVTMLTSCNRVLSSLSSDSPDAILAALWFTFTIQFKTMPYVGPVGGKGYCPEDQFD